MVEVKNLSVHFRSPSGNTVAVDHLGLEISPGETVAVVGESGSGKTVMALALTRLLPEPPVFYPTGDVLLNGVSVLRMGSRALRQVRGGQIAYVFQEPSTSLNPVLTIGRQVAENIQAHRSDVKNVRTEAIFWLDQVGIMEPAQRLDAYPFQLSGGMQQRVMIAMALSGRPQLLVADEPTTALDVTIQKQILELFADLKRRLGMSILLITHNFGIIRGLADRVVVMFRGRAVETGPADVVLSTPRHPYTQALIQCVPRLGRRLPRLQTIDHDHPAFDQGGFDR